MIHETAIIDSSAKIAPNVEIGPFSIIGPNVVIGEGTWVGSHAVIKGPCNIGKECRIFQFTSIGEGCQDKKYSGEDTLLDIGDRNIFREGCTVHRGTIQGGGITKIGNDNLFMVNTHVAHDCIIKNHVIFSNGASIAGHVTVGDYASLGGLVGVHQFCSIGAHSFSAGGTIIYKDVLPYVKVSGVPAKSYGLNTVGLERRGFSEENIKMINSAYKIIFRTSKTVSDAVAELKKLIPGSDHINCLVDFLLTSERGIIR